MYRVVDNPSNGYRCIRLSTTKVISANADSTCLIASQDVVDDHWTRSQTAIVQSDHVSDRAGIWPIDRLGGHRFLTRSNRLRRHYIHVDEAVAQVARRWNQVDTVLGRSQDRCTGDDQLALIAESIRVTKIFSPLCVLTVLDHRKRRCGWNATAIEHCEVGVSEQVRCYVAVELNLGPTSQVV